MFRVWVLIDCFHIYQMFACTYRVSSDQMFAYLPKSGGFVVYLWLHIVWSAADILKYFKQAIQTFLNYFKQTLCSFQIKFEPKR